MFCLHPIGFDKSKAIKDAISKIPSTDPEVQAFIQEGKEKILDYYTKNCETIILKAEGLTKRDEYEQAIGLLLSIPSEVGECFALAQRKAVEAYDTYKEKYCVKLLTFAKSSIATQDYYNASCYLMSINPETSCYKEAQKLIKQIEQKITAAEKLEYERKREQKKEQNKLEIKRIDAAKEVVKAFYKNQPQTVNYNNIVR